MLVRVGAAICGAMIVFGCSSMALAESGVASVYTYSGQLTANGER
jgi:rare lipoprotein A (peptidoglycan hydrolase)